MLSSNSKMKKKKKFRAVSQKRKIFRSNDPLLGVLMWGVNHTINELSHVNVPVMLMPDDFKAFSKIRVDNHSYNKENLPSHFKFKEYCPMVFRHLRERFGVNDQELAKSFLESPLASSSQGRSGAKFFTSRNKKFYIKTIESEEVERLHTFLQEYHHYVVKQRANTLLPQYLAMYRITVDGKETYVLVMKSVFGSRLKIHKKYDLKGSTVDRQASNKEKSKDQPTFKDNDFTKDNVKIVVGDEAKADLVEKVKDDVEFLTSLNIMDYSLLLGIHDCELAEAGDAFDEDEGVGDESRCESNEESDPDSPQEGELSASPPDTPPATDEDRFRSLSVGSDCDDKEDDFIFSVHSTEGGKREIYFMGIIDVLTYYGAGKKAAHAAKTVKHGAGAEISTVKPENYAKRFLEFIDRIVE
ncbi:phosphatidylinositol 5-phosphate 4-kinase type-2 alpha isoform X2 [Exaiptasia diaphana]|uniref:1-phosphatidylinositol-5-phosphate 4-kinase n=1 Tax=Exaiptasia diaphana TaxID=2652724 RepID=A0A913XEA8_EXADI|nr:phosphatidylinositol 5-phosphate 4-kinase type-2 alpha isoform X2 [Exaiptasia diaphana]